MTLEQLRAANVAGGVAGVTLKGQGGAFLVEIATRSGPNTFLSKARSREPRCFGNPAAALQVLRNIGITAGGFDASAWDPGAKQPSTGNRGRAEAMRKAHQAAAYTAWLNAEIETSLVDSQPTTSLDDTMAIVDAEIAALGKKPPRTKRN